ncbi:MAG: CRTAC1 family protein [Verrucomicrobia bacterium]|nr:CRTAC1 family protein [Verrucomicrobiota bacterium]
MSARSKKLVAVVLLVSLLTGAAFLAVRRMGDALPGTESSSASSKAGERFADQLAAFEAKEHQVAETTWAKEMLAQQCGRTLESLWDSLNAATNKLRLAAGFPIGEIVLGQWDQPKVLSHGIEVKSPKGTGPVLSREQWRDFVEEVEHSGWQLEQTEFRHTRFETHATGQPRQSRFYFSAHLTHPLVADRAILEGDLVVDWAPKASNASAPADESENVGQASGLPVPGTPSPSDSGSGTRSELEDKTSVPREDLPVVRRIDASGLRVKTRRGEVPFQRILLDQFTPETPSAVESLVLYDLDGDGLSEIILASKNLVYRWSGNGHLEAEPLCKHAAGSIFTGIIADFDGDGSADLLAEKSEGMVLFKGSPEGAFDQPGRLAWSPPSGLKNAMVLTCGDIDHDGDLDVFLGQYKIPTLGQILRPHYYDARDGHPSFLLLNDGHGEFSDATLPAGLGTKQRRRVFSASFADLNRDGHLDLLVVSDFAGVDLYANDGRGHFTDVTGEWIADPSGFGMAHALADFNADGRLDFLMIGMNSPTADRLGHLGLTRPPGSEAEQAMRRRMTFGNRLYLSRGGSGFEQTSLNDAIARSGWSWGCSAFDFDNDGFPEVYVANGHETKQSVRDYEPEFWLHDIFVDNAVDDAVATAYFTAKFARTRGRGWSYGGYEKNRLFLNQRGESFVEIGHLMGVALEQDSRNVVADDLDGDGRIDLVFTTSEVWPAARQTLQVYRNTLDSGGAWIGFRFREQGGGRSPVGAQVTLRGNGRSVVRQIVTGDSLRSQHANTLHFGLGETDRVETVEVRWSNGRVRTLRKPALNRYHIIRAPE